MIHTSLIILSPLGDLLAIANESHLVMLEFLNSDRIEWKLRQYRVTPSKETENPILRQTRDELYAYFSQKRSNFTIPIAPEGTLFQKSAWLALEHIPYGETRSYKEEALLAGNPKAIRAIGGANNKNPIIIIIPCHRVIGSDGNLVGYEGGIERKKYLLHLESTSPLSKT